MLQLTVSDGENVSVDTLTIRILATAPGLGDLPDTDDGAASSGSEVDPPTGEATPTDARLETTETPAPAASLQQPNLAALFDEIDTSGSPTAVDDGSALSLVDESDDATFEELFVAAGTVELDEEDALRQEQGERELGDGVVRSVNEEVDREAADEAGLEKAAGSGFFAGLLGLFRSVAGSTHKKPRLDERDGHDDTKRR